MTPHSLHPRAPAPTSEADDEFYEVLGNIICYAFITAVVFAHLLVFYRVVSSYYEFKRDQQELSDTVTRIWNRDRCLVDDDPEAVLITFEDYPFGSGDNQEEEEKEAARSTAPQYTECEPTAANDPAPEYLEPEPEPTVAPAAPNNEIRGRTIVIPILHMDAGGLPIDQGNGYEPDHEQVGMPRDEMPPPYEDATQEAARK